MNIIRILLLIFACGSLSAQNHALLFDGIDDRVTGTMSALPQGNAPRTIEAWIKYTTGNDMAIFKYGTDQNNQVFALHLYNGVYIIGYFNDISTGFAVNDGLWHHLAVTHNGTITKVYVDGIERGSKTTTYNTTGTDFQIGTYFRNTYQFHYNGTIEEVRVWNVARSQAEIQANMNQVLNSGTGLIAAFHFNETSGTTATDAVGGNNGTLSNFNFNSNSGWVSSTVLSVEMLNFEGENTERGKNTLTWTTASEKDNSHFDIERSTDGITFHSIGEVNGHNKPSSYQYVDVQPFSRSYYRLKQVDFDGTATYSKVISVEQRSKGLKVYPTLVTGGILSMDTEGEQPLSYSICNLLGQEVLSGKTSQQIDVSALRQGTFVLKVGTEVVKFVKQ